MEIRIFKFHESEVTTVDIGGDVWFVASEVCDLLDIKNTSDAVSRLDEDEKLLSVLPIAGQNRSISLISESGLYALVFKSNKPSAKKFRKWITEEVIPTIRKTGSYSVQKQLSPAQMLLQQAQMLVDMEMQIVEVKEEVQLIKAKAISSPSDYFSIAGYASLNKKVIDVKSAAELGRKASMLCKNMGYTMGSMPDPRFGTVRLYPMDVLKTVFA